MLALLFIAACAVEETTDETSEQESGETIPGEILAAAQNSECTEKGELTENYFHNEDTKTWWIDLEMKEEFENELCNPACVVFEETLATEINWRCTGALPPE